MAKDIARLARGLACQPVPGGAGIFGGRGFRGQGMAAFAKAPVVHRQHRKAQFVEPAYARGRARHIPARTVQKQKLRRLGAGGRHPQAMQLHLLAAARGVGNIDFLHARRVGARPGAVAGLEDPHALLGIQLFQPPRRAARQQHGHGAEEQALAGPESNGRHGCEWVKR